MIVNEDILRWCEVNTEKFHAVFCDPPYELGFMGKSWDSTGIAFDKNTWAAISRHLYPGAYLLAFGGTRTFHRIAVAIEDAGFEIRDTVMWVYSQGFPKSHNVGKAVDKANGNEREVVGVQTLKGNAAVSTKEKGGTYISGASLTAVKDIELTRGNSPWEGYGTALKPSWEPIIIARKPLEGTVAQNALKYGSGALNIDGSRVGLGENDDTKRVVGGHKTSYIGGELKKNYGIENQANRDLGRWPANLIHDGSDEVVGMFPNTKSGKMKQHIEGGDFNVYGKQYPRDVETIGDSGSAARFFYSAKVSKRERDAGLEGFAVGKVGHGNLGNSDGFERFDTKAHNTHPTLKPIALTTYLAKLILPPKLDKPRRLLVPFAGSGSEVIGGYLAGWDKVLGVEREKEYAEIAEARIKHWTKSSPQPSSSSTSVQPESTDGQEILDI